MFCFLCFRQKYYLIWEVNIEYTVLFDAYCKKLGIEHKRIRPRTPRHNGKVERSHRSDQERFYNYLRFYSFDDLKLQMTRYRRRANLIPMQSLNWLSPIQKRNQLMQAS